jgi:hypothetical protein
MPNAIDPSASELAPPSHEAAPELAPVTGVATSNLPSSAPAKKYLVGVLYYGAVDREHARCVEALRAHPYIHDVMELTGCPYIDMGRSIIATHVLDQPDIGGLLFIDHDMVFDWSEAAKVIESAEASQGVAGAAYSMRRPGRIIGAIDGGKLPAGKKVVFFEGGEALPANHLGMGMTAIHRRVFERLVAAADEKHARRQELFDSARSAIDTGAIGRALTALDTLHSELKEHELMRLATGISDAPVVPFFSHLQRRHVQAPKGTIGIYFGEDVSFCVRCHEADVPVALDTRARVFHKGSYLYSLEDVGMQVPYCDRLEALDTGARDPECKPAFHSENPLFQAALDEAYPGQNPRTFTPHPTPTPAPTSEGQAAE